MNSKRRKKTVMLACTRVLLLKTYVVRNYGISATPICFLFQKLPIVDFLKINEILLQKVLQISKVKEDFKFLK